MKGTIENQFLRVFCAVELPEIVRARAAEHIAAMRRLAPHSSARWERPEKLHITLKFLGDIPPTRLASVTAATATAAATCTPFDLAIEATGAFPLRGAARILWLGITDESKQLAQLQVRLENECADQGFAREDRPFHPHLTLARLRTPEADRQLTEAHKTAGFDGMRFPVNEIVVMRSELGPGGSRYSVLERCHLSSV